MANVAAALVAAKIVDKRGCSYKNIKRHATHKGWRYMGDDCANIHQSSVVGGQGGAGDSGAPRAGPDSGIQGVRCLLWDACE
ncbi:hypothetical protein [Paralcaligenes ureilyticus]|uniref:hypothetical protein n=1 Tax=Paralcaligenes ureilyticus TaxID=627131 RepID=UPI0010483247|nr:hypothetical protein [Paralcaligenes ureilyticus]